MKITIIDILNKIARGEEPPKKIMYKDKEYTLRKQYGELLYQYEDYHAVLTLQDFNRLNDEVEILEITITNKPDKIKKLYFHDLDDISDNEKILIVKINEIIDKVNDL